MFRLGVIRPFHSPWASPVVLITKKDGSIRFRVDYRRRNRINWKDVCPLPRTNTHARVPSRYQSCIFPFAPQYAVAEPIGVLGNTDIAQSTYCFACFFSSLSRSREKRRAAGFYSQRKVGAFMHSERSTNKSSIDFYF